MTDTTSSQTGQNTNTQSGSGETGARLSSPLVAALESVWAGIQARHPEVPDVVIVMASGSTAAPRGMLRLGHFAAMRWTATTNTTGTTGTDTGVGGAGGRTLPEVFVGGEGLARGAVDVLGTLLHEAAHALAHVRGVQDTSRQGRYHNKRFKALGEELGLDLHEVTGIGWSGTSVPDATRTEYAAEIDALTAALTIHRRTEGTPLGTGGDDGNGTDGDGNGDGEGAGTASGSRNGTAARCGCGRRIRVTASVLALGPITCGLCGTPFTSPAPDTTDEEETTGDGPDEPDTDPVDTDPADTDTDTGMDVDLDVEGSASRQHWIDTGHYLTRVGDCPCDHTETATPTAEADLRDAVADLDAANTAGAELLAQLDAILDRIGGDR